MIVIDRFEGDYALIERDGVMVEVKRHLLPAEAKEGDVLRLVDGRYEIDEAKTAERTKEMEALLGTLFKK